MLKSQIVFSECERPILFDGFLKTALCVKYDLAPVYFLLSERGNAMEVHVGAESRQGRLLLRDACRCVLEWIKNTYPWCEMVIAPVKETSVYNLCKKIGFFDFGLCDYYGSKARLMVWVD